ncbi:fasciclin domain-containing protein [Mucilaginibacter sp. HMF5004]|uniref:fasciclin domain-containing protein n=1 Tax=Mucilaginibacter rivuli TaxID=2857527 RepID=UPI001C5D922D|nr:fasciclin domain-containing protein [Mucilaginibacter rivuli]MBW4889956.1 fasciclin domain-containing protein [Mucilaginibacter rivuli]
MLVIGAGCHKKAFDDYYASPANLGDPIFQQLQQRGNFQHLTKVITKAGYQNILSTTGWWTMFAPNDAAFEKYYTATGLTDASITDSLAKSIVKYSLVFNGYRQDQLSTYQVAGTNASIAGEAYKRKTAFYDWVQPSTDGIHNKIIATNRNNGYKSGSNLYTYVEGDNNNKYIPYFTDLFLSTNGLSATDYNSFYPNTTYSGFNVAGAKVLNKDIVASNGFINEIDQVIVPLKSLDQYLGTNPDYSEFKKLLDSLSAYNANAYITHNLFVATGSTDQVYIKSYDGRLAFSPNNENYQDPLASGYIANASQSNGWSMVVPNNLAMNAYRKKLLGKLGGSFFKTAQPSVIIDFLNSVMWPSSLWPSQFKSGTNYQLEGTTMALADVVDKQMLSNGILYGVNKPQESNVFRTIYGIPYLDPKTNMTYQANSYLPTGIKAQITQPTIKNTLFIMSDSVMALNGWRYNEASVSTSATAWGFKSSSSSSYAHNLIYRDIALRMFSTGVLPGVDLTSLSGTGIIETINHEYIKYNNNRIQTSGTVDSGTDLKVLKTDATAINGTAYYVDGLLSFTNLNVGQHIQNLATLYPASYSSFYTFLSTSPFYNTTTKAIIGIGTSTDNNYTIFVPTNAAISNAIKAGLLPGNKTTGALPASAPTAALDIDLVRKFILYHIINGASVVPDGKKANTFITMLVNETGGATYVNITNQPGSMVVTDHKGVNANVVVSTSNNLSNRTVIHTIDNYLNYN